jgi:DnaJ-class molecular chaperone
MRAKDYDLKALRRAILLLARHARVSMRLAVNPSVQLATTAVFEIMHWQCRQCHGASEQRINGIRQVCPSCEGIGVHRWSDYERARTSGYTIETWRFWSTKYEQILKYGRFWDSRTNGDAKIRLGIEK